jgi:chemotaxis protein methyltransferase CheR
VERDSDIELRLLIEAIYLKYSYDFRDYSGASIKRRVHHALGQFECKTISALQERVLHDPGAFMQLLQLLTIPVSEMFRDPTHFLAIREEVVPLLRTYPSIKIWIAGCSTGEEVYSMAILLREEGLLDRTLIYATDINPRSLEKCAGLHPQLPACRRAPIICRLLHRCLRLRDVRQNAMRKRDLCRSQPGDR